MFRQQIITIVLILLDLVIYPEDYNLTRHRDQNLSFTQESKNSDKDNNTKVKFND